MAHTTVRLIHLVVAKIAQSKNSIISSKGPFKLITLYSVPLCRVVPIRDVVARGMYFLIFITKLF